MYKYVIYRDEDPASIISELRKRYNTEDKEYYFLGGKHKGNNAIFILNDLVNKKYSEPIQSCQFKEALFFPPTDEHTIDLDEYEIQKSKREYKVKVDLVCGRTIYIIPASMEPKRIVFSFDEAEEEDNPYSTATEYGRLAYAIYDKKDDISLGDKNVKKLVMLSLLKSYSLPLDMWNWLGIISLQDFDNILTAAMGFNPELTKKKVDGLPASAMETSTASN